MAARTPGRGGGRGQGRGRLPQVQRVAAYAVILREAEDGQRILLSRLSERVTRDTLWTLPGGGLDHGEDPRAAVVREVYEETGLPVEVGETVWVFSFHQAPAWRRERRVDAHALRLVYDGWVPLDVPDPHPTEVGGSTAEAAWIRVADVRSGAVPVVSLVTDALDAHRPTRLQRLACYALITRPQAGSGTGEEVLLTRISPRGFHSGAWTLPGGGLEFGEDARSAVVREVREECGIDCVVGELLDVDDISVTGAAPSGRHEEFHGVHLIFAASVADDAAPRVVEVGGTTDAVAWVPVSRLDGLDVLPVVRTALAATRTDRD